MDDFGLCCLRIAAVPAVALALLALVAAWDYYAWKEE